MFSLSHNKTETSHRHMPLLPLQSMYKPVIEELYIIDLCIYVFLKLLNNGLCPIERKGKEKYNSCLRAVK